MKQNIFIQKGKHAQVVLSFYLISLLSFTMTSCLEEYQPSQGFTQEQLNESDTRLPLLCAAIKRAMFYSYSSSLRYNFGYPSMMIINDAMCAELPVQATGYDYLSWWEQNTYLGKSYAVSAEPWHFYFNLIQKSNLAIAVANPQLNSPLSDLHYLGSALCYRAMAYMDMTRLYEFKATGYPELDDAAEYNITVPIIDEHSTEEMARNNPRAPFYKMYRFIMNDLNDAELYLQGWMPDRKNDAGIGVAYGLKARMWLEMGCRFEQKPADLAEMISHENDPELSGYDPLGVTTAKQCYENAAKYARWALALNYTPVTEDQWYDTKTGFNTANDAWMWAIQYGTEDVTESWKSFTGFLAPEATFGLASTNYFANRMIDAQLYKKVPKSDWRYYTWIAKEDAGKTQGYSNYKTLYSADKWVGFNALTGFKFRPGSGNMDDYKAGCAVDIPLMRVEEMYLINAEATARAYGVAKGRIILEDFLNTYRYTDESYMSKSTTLSDFIIEVLDQKRIEFWGESVAIWDYKRCCRSIERDYSGTNHPSAFRFHSKEGYSAPWLTIVIAQAEEKYNTALVNHNNPDPSGYHE